MLSNQGGQKSKCHLTFGCRQTGARPGAVETYEGFPRTGVPFLGVLIIRTVEFWGLYWVHPFWDLSFEDILEVLGSLWNKIRHSHENFRLLGLPLTLSPNPPKPDPRKPLTLNPKPLNLNP